MDNIQRHSITTKAGNTLSVFYNPENNLLVVDLIHKNELGGNELVRITLDEKRMLKHAIDQEKAQKRLESQYETLKGRVLESCTDKELQILMAYCMWKDGADWPVAEEFYKNCKDFNRDGAIETLEDVYQHPIESEGV